VVLVSDLIAKHKAVAGRKRENARRLLIAFEPENKDLQASLRPVINMWIEETDWFEERAHVGKAINEKDLDVHFETFERVLGTFAQYFYEGFEEIEQIVEKANASGGRPSDAEVGTVVLRLARPKYRLYFFDKLENVHWIAPLRDKDFFQSPPEPKEGEAYERWPEGWYLKKMASKVPEEVLEVIREIRSRNLFVCNACIECLLEMPENVAARGVEVVENMLPRRVEEGNWGWYSGGQQASKLMTKLVKVKPEQAFKIVWVLLDAWIPKENKGFRDITAKFTEHDYRELVLKFYAEVWKVEPERAFWVLAKILNRCLEKLDKENEYDVSSHYYLGQGLRDLNSIDVGYGGIETILVKGMCEAGKVLIQEAPKRVSDLMEELQKLKRAIFLRIEMYLLRFVPGGVETERIQKIISNTEYLEEPGYQYEYKLLLKDKFDEVLEARKIFEKRINEQKVDNVDDWKDWFKRVTDKEPAKEDLDKYEAGMKARELFLVKERYQQIYEKYKTESGLNDAELAPRRMVGEGRAVSPMEGTPLQPEVMEKNKVDEVLDFIVEPKNYEGKKKPGEWREPGEALRATFKEDVKKRPIEYLKEGREKLAKLPAGFLSGFFYGISDKVRDGSFEKDGWGDLIGLAHEVTKEKQNDKVYRECFSGILNALRNGFTQKDTTIEFDKKTIANLWGILETLVRYEEDYKASSDERDPVQMRCTSVNGEALEQVVMLGIVCKRDLEEYYEENLKSEIGKLLDYIVKEVRRPEVNCTFGLDMARIYYLDKKWLGKNIEKVFEGDMWDVVWGTYASWGRPSPSGFNLLVERGKYARAIELIGKPNKFKFGKDPEEGLVEHLMIGFFNDWIGLDGDLLKNFFGKASAELRGKAARFLTTGFKSVNEDGGKEKEKVATKMKEYWGKRIEAIKDEPEGDNDEAIELTGWVEDSVLPAKETLELLEQSLDLSGGKIGKMRDARDFVDGVCELGKGNELLALRCLKKAAADENMHMTWADIQEPLVKFLETMVESPENVKNEAREVADLYGRYNPDKFRDVWEKLRKRQAT
jgi:hypothetical protein